MKKLIAILFLLGSVHAQIQYLGGQVNFMFDSTTFHRNSVINTDTLIRYKVYTSGQGTFAKYFFKNIYFGKYNSTRIDNRPTSIAWFGTNGQFMRSPIDSIYPAIKSILDANYPSMGSFNSAVNGKLNIVDTTNKWRPYSWLPSWSQVLSKPTTLAGYGITDAYPLTGNPSGFITTNNTYAAGYGITKTGTEPSATFSINTTDIMTANRAADSIAMINTKINGKVSNSNTISINGNSQTLGSNPSYTLNTGNISESGNLYFTQARARTSISLTTTGTGAASYNNSTGVLNIPTNTGVSISINNAVARSLNSNYTISATRSANVTYSINISWNIAALLSGSGTAFLEYSTNGGSSWVTVNQVSKSIGLLTFAGADDMNLTGWIPVNALVRIRTTASNMTITYTTGQETYY